MVERPASCVTRNVVNELLLPLELTTCAIAGIDRDDDDPNCPIFPN